MTTFINVNLLFFNIRLSSSKDAREDKIKKISFADDHGDEISEVN